MATGAPRKPVVIASRASLRVEPTGARVPREYALDIELWPSAPSADILAEARAFLAGAMAPISPDATLNELRSMTGGRGEPVVTHVSGVVGELKFADWPPHAVLATLRAQLIEHGYEVSITARRVCAEPGCTADAGVAWANKEERPRDWYSERICGRHNYRSCSGCGSVFRLVSSNATGPAPSLPCPICHVLLVEWGGTKLWDAELVTAGP